jgi:hypothetical protein
LVEPQPKCDTFEIKFFPGHPDRILAVVCSTDAFDLFLKPKSVHLFECRRPEYWWGVAWLPEFWLTALLAGALAWSVWRDKKTNMGRVKWIGTTCIFGRGNTVPHSSRAFGTVSSEARVPPYARIAQSMRSHRLNDFGTSKILPVPNETLMMHVV